MVLVGGISIDLGGVSRAINCAGLPPLVKTTWVRFGDKSKAFSGVPTIFSISTRGVRFGCVLIFIGQLSFSPDRLHFRMMSLTFGQLSRRPWRSGREDTSMTMVEEESTLEALTQSP